jgi:hypothetical protein
LVCCCFLRRHDIHCYSIESVVYGLVTSSSSS